MSGIYFHVPYCKQACHYCDFHFSTQLGTKDKMVNAMVSEISLRADYLPDKRIDTVYFGGGTPSLLRPADWQMLLERVHEVFEVSPQAEITLEANPDDLTEERLNALRLSGINRLSIGIQSFHEPHLRWMNRGHHAGQALACIENAKKAGFSNYSIDLIYGFPDLTDAQWDDNINRALQLGVPHISCYSLTVEAGTALHHFVKTGKVQPPDDEQSARQFIHLINRLTDAGYEHYEVSNFALPGFRSKHNSAYWKSEPYLGIGPSAHSYNKTSRCWNAANNHLYIKSMASGSMEPECEEINARTAYHEYILTRLRTIEGINTSYVANEFGIDINANFNALITQLENENKIIREGNNLRLGREGMLWADQIASQLFISET